jgi:hypothetical protein
MTEIRGFQDQLRLNGINARPRIDVDHFRQASRAVAGKSFQALEVDLSLSEDLSAYFPDKLSGSDKSSFRS